MDRVTLRKVQMVQLEIAKEIKRVCEINNINYFLDSGTLLGAVRHKGFIPWDDDLDIGMLRPDYDKFLEIADKCLNEKYKLVTWRNEAEYPNPMAKVVKRGTIYKEEARHDNATQGIWVDLFAYDHVPKDKKMQKDQGKKITLYRALIRAKCRCKTWRVHNSFIVTKWLKNIPVRILSLFYSKNRLVDIYEENAQKYNSLPADLYFANGSSQYGKWSIPVSCFERYTELKFEDEIFKVPYNYDLYLKIAYGNYMELPPVEQRENRHSITAVDFGE